MATVSIHIVSYNALLLLQRCITSLRQHTYTDYSLVVIDNGSTDGTKEYLESLTNVTCVFNEENKGFAYAHNQGIKESTSRYVLILNQDVVLAPLCLEKLVTFMESHSHCNAVQPRLLQSDIHGERTEYIDSVGLTHHVWGQVTERGQGEHDWGQYYATSKVFGVTGACALYRRDVLEQIKIGSEYFDSDFFMYKEDVDLAYRLRRKGGEAWYVSDAIAYHGRTVGKQIPLSKRSLQSRILSFSNSVCVVIKNERMYVWPLASMYVCVYVLRIIIKDFSILRPSFMRLWLYAHKMYMKRYEALNTTR